MNLETPKLNFAPKISIFDTTLRDGEQTPGVRFSHEAKIAIARKLDELGVDIIEAGTAINSKTEIKTIKEITKLGLKAKIGSFARIVKMDIDAVAEAEAEVIGLVFPASDLHIAEKLKMSKENALEEIVKSAQYAKERGLIVELMAEDGSRADFKFLKNIALNSKQVGVEAFCICDTVGGLTPEKTRSLYEYLKSELKMGLSFHGHNDTGLAVANTLAAISAGADKLHTTINGLGERTGNCPLEQVALNLKFHYNIETVKLDKMYETSKLVAGYSNLYPAWNTPVIGRKVFTHESGIHVDGMFKNQWLYQLFEPKLIGRKHDITLGKLSGKKSVEFKLKELGLSVAEEKKAELLSMVKNMGELGLEVGDADFIMLVRKINESGKAENVILEEIQVSTGNRITPNAYVRIRIKNAKDLIFGAAIGNGPVDAAMRAIDNAIGNQNIELVSYHVDAITGGSNANVRVNVRVRKEEKELTSSALGSDIVLVSVEAYRKALNVL